MAANVGAAAGAPLITHKTHPSVPIHYEALVQQAFSRSGSVALDKLVASLEEAWLSAYSDMCTHEPNVLQFADHGFTFLFDQSSGSGSDAEDRLVAGYGRSSEEHARRDASRIRGFLGGRIEISGKGIFDKGHVLAHAMGGGLDVNLFPQRPQLNQGRSSEGKRYRQMERYAAKHPGTFVFSRLLYVDATWVPVSLEYGILLPEGKFWVEQFAN